MLIFAADSKKDMYAYLEGKFTMKNAAQVYVDINGVGYELNISLNTFTYIQNLEKGKLYTYLQIKEDGHTLYGFFDKGEKEMFIQLISVSGVGAATARMMLSHLKPEEVSKAIIQNNVKLLESVKGIGKKTAERLVLELRDKVAKAATDLSLPATVGNRLQQDALNALVSLGISRPQAELAIQKINHTEPDINNLEDLIKKALKAI
ncbi:Holliday junction branch migration protein RuvA [Ferruginibacter paludis]|uniref:Holliday junction branch migration protein RuvA n=1 Tax=Ferruginibacter paludis TaxID=1310417 RepID=UPI0025B2FB9E|nr:Holliday junction branch migration protein RuvA [Ferruginibacter paludis]MDN3658728.1 Holliday junction branch migration protein RuvA [Ferruginibacter paludis]